MESRAKQKSVNFEWNISVEISLASKTFHIFFSDTMCKQLNHKDGDVQAFKSLLIVLKAAALHFSKIFKYAEGNTFIFAFT